jgi:hypothetical protein
MVGFLLLAETEDYRLPGHLSRSGSLLHLVYESTPPNQRLLLPGRSRLSRREVCLMGLDCGGFGTPRGGSAGR